MGRKTCNCQRGIRNIIKNVALTKDLLTFLIEDIPKTRGCSCEKALSEAEF